MSSGPQGESRTPAVPWFGARRMARRLAAGLQALRNRFQEGEGRLRRLRELDTVELEQRGAGLQAEIAGQAGRLEKARAEGAETIRSLELKGREPGKSVVVTQDVAGLQESGVYDDRHPLADAVAYREELDRIREEIRSMNREAGGAVLASTTWTVNGSAPEGRAMARDVSRLMLRAFNAEADAIVRALKPCRLEGAIERLTQAARTIARLGKSMEIRMADAYVRLRIRELELTADFLQKKARRKEAERAGRARLREERKVQQEIARERARLERERQHYANALEALMRNGDEASAGRIRRQLEDIDRAIDDVDYRAANLRAGYVYVVSNIGAFGDDVVKIGMTRRADPMGRIRELGDVSVPFDFDVHALLFSHDAVGIEDAMHERLAPRRINTVDRRRGFFRATPLEAKAHLRELAGELLQFEDVPEAREYRQGLRVESPEGGGRHERSSKSTCGSVGRTTLTRACVTTTQMTSS